MRVLMMEDNEDDYILFREHLAAATADHFEIVWHETLGVGLAYLNTVAVDVLLPGMGLPDSQGSATFIRMQARRVEFEPVWLDLNAMCRSVIDEFESRPDITQQIVYTCDDVLHEAKLDKKLMRQIINNLVSNAVKYSAPGTTIAISLAYSGASLVLRVIDQGIGIPEADLKHLFVPFHRAANVGAISGTGLGLVIVKESVELHGGTISADSQVGQETTFTVVIPVSVKG